jgi:YVTN family beta-propeller protein
MNRCRVYSLALILGLIVCGARVNAQSEPAQVSTAVEPVPNMDQQITPLAPPGSRFEPLKPDLKDKPEWLAGQAVTTAISPDGRTLLILTSGYNRVYTTNDPPAGKLPWSGPDSNEYVFIYDISTRMPVKKQVVQVPNSYNGIAFDPIRQAFYVAGGADDNVHVFALAAGIWSEDLPPLALGHHGLGIGLDLKPNGALAINSQVGVRPCAAGIALSRDGRTLVVANYYNDSITVFRGGYGRWSRVPVEVDLRPGKQKTGPAQTGIAGGEYPFWVVIEGNGTNATAYVSSVRDREIDVVRLRAAPVVAARIPLRGQPNKLTLNAAQSLLYVAEDRSDLVDVIDTTKNAVIETIPLLGPASVVPSALTHYAGVNPNSVALAPDEKHLYVTSGNLNDVAVIELNGVNRGDRVVGLIPTGWYPNSVSIVQPRTRRGFEAAYLYVVNGKSPTGANPGWCYGGYGPPNSPTCFAANQYNPQTTKAGFQIFPLPNAAQLAALTAQVARNDRFSSTENAADSAVMAAVRRGVRHVIFIIKENRTYDQILGDLEVGNGDPDLTEFGAAVTPNEHRLARQFVTLDNFLDTAEVSYDGWLWTTSAQAPDVVERQFPVAYAGRTLSLDSEGANRNVNVALATLAERQSADPFTSDDPDVLPGRADVSAPDGPNNEIDTGYLWDAALRAHLTVRNYGFFADMTRYGTADYAIPVLRNPFASGIAVAYPTNVALTPYTDRYFRGFDNSLPDYYRYAEWARDFDARYARGPRGGTDLPALSLVRLMHDHTGNFSQAIDRVNTPDLEVSDNDYAVGLVVEKIARSAYANNTLIFVVEDDAQDGGDHVDSHRSTAFVVGAYVKQGALVSTRYTTVDFVRTIEDVLGLAPLNLNDALARPMADVFTTSASPWSFKAIPSALLYNTALPLPARRAGLVVPKPAHDATYWAKATRGLNLTDADRVDPALFNRILWAGMRADTCFPAVPASSTRCAK